MTRDRLCEKCAPFCALLASRKQIRDIAVLAYPDAEKRRSPKNTAELGALSLLSGAIEGANSAGRSANAGTFVGVIDEAVCMTDSTDKPYFECPIEIGRNQYGKIGIIVTKRDGKKELIPAPPAFAIGMRVEAFQPAGTDTVRLRLPDRRPQ